MPRCSLLELNETRKENERESFLSKICFDNLYLNRLFMLELDCDNNYGLREDPKQ